MPVSNKPQPVKAAVIAHSLAGLSNVKIANLLGITRQTVAKILKESEINNVLSTKNRFEQLHITPERVLTELARMAFVDPRKFFNDNGTAKEITQLDDNTAPALAGVEVFEEFQGKGKDRELVGYTKKFKLADKGQNLERLGRHFGLFQTTVEHKHTGTITHELSQSEKLEAVRALKRIEAFASDNPNPIEGELLDDAK